MRIDMRRLFDNGDNKPPFTGNKFGPAVSSMTKLLLVTTNLSTHRERLVAARTELFLGY
jgi:hypothetical protein